MWNPSSLIVTRALFGAGEAGAFPNLTRVLTTWLPVKDRERTQAWVWLATRLSGAFTPILVASFYGMNVALPGQAHAHAFIGTLLVSTLLGLAVAVYFRRRGWL